MSAPQRRITIGRNTVSGPPDPIRRCDATAGLLMQAMIAETYEHARVVWAENRVRCAITGECDPDLPCGPNEAQKKVEAWLVYAGMLPPAADPHPASADIIAMAKQPQPPSTPRRARWRRALQLVAPTKSSKIAAPTPKSPSRISPLKLWSTVRKRTPSFPGLRRTHSAPPALPAAAVPTRRTKCLSVGSAPLCRDVPQTPIPVPEYPTFVPLCAMNRAELAACLMAEDGDAPLPFPSLRSEDVPSPPSPPPSSSPKAKSNAPTQWPDPASYRWPPPPPPPRPPPQTQIPAHHDIDACPDARWYHPLIVLGLWYLFFITLSVYGLARVFLKPVVCLLVLYYVVLGVAAVAALCC
ncbi:hypothetical protein B0H10DRAFT_2239311 [Mycena sp. CBHHK59/15]|nr:hypothetical protein B0H10DRAFT_2239311 [Mycena sp. CBHHK59/15]